MSTVSSGSAAENAVARHQRAHGWLVGSMRHMKGGGDLLCVHTVSGVVWLVEVKKTSRKYLWQRFDRPQRREMIETPLPPGGERFVVNVLNVKAEEFEWWPEAHWPTLLRKEK